MCEKDRGLETGRGGEWGNGVGQCQLKSNSERTHLHTIVKHRACVEEILVSLNFLIKNDSQHRFESQKM